MSLASEAPQLVDASSGLQSSRVAAGRAAGAVVGRAAARRPAYRPVGPLLGALVPVVLFVYTVVLFFQLQGLDRGERSR